MQTQQRKKQHSYSSFHEEHLAQSEQQKDQERHRSELNQQMSEEQRVAILKEVTETQEALRELRKQPPPQHTVSFSDFSFTFHFLSLFLSKVANRFHNGENDSHKRQFLAFGVRSQFWKLNNLSKKISCQIDWCYKLLATI